jgi:hypothetical protein
MTALSFIVPYQRVSPLYLPRRDLVLDAADSLSLAVTVIETDAPDAALIDLATGPTFPTFTLQVWPDSAWFLWDYGAANTTSARLVLEEVEGEISSRPGTIEFTLEATTLANWPMRCGFSIRMDHDTTLSETLMAGTLHVRGGGMTAQSGIFTLDGRLGVLA